MRFLKKTAAAMFLVVVSLDLTGCQGATLDEIKAADSRIVLTKSSVLGDKWFYEDSLGMRKKMEPCGVVSMDKCFKVPGSSMELSYPLMGGSVVKDGKISGAAMGSTLHCKESALPWDPEVLCAVL